MLPGVLNLLAEGVPPRLGLLDFDLDFSLLC